MRHIDFRRLLDAGGHLAPRHGRARAEASFAAAAVTAATSAGPPAEPCLRCGRGDPPAAVTVLDDGCIQVRCPACEETVRIDRWQGSRWDARGAMPATGSDARVPPSDPGSPPTLRAYLAAQDSGRLADLLVDLADAHEAVRERLERFRHAGDPERLAALFRATLDHWTTHGRWPDWHDGEAWTCETSRWLDEVAGVLMPVDPGRALALFQAFIEADGVWSDAVHDRENRVGDLVGVACGHWLDAAARCETPAGGWHVPLLNLVAADACGGRDELLRGAGRLLEDDVLRRLIRAFEARAAAGSGSANAAPVVQVPELSMIDDARAASLLAQALGDPDHDAVALRSRAEAPHPHERMDLARRYLDKGRPLEALAWIDDPGSAGDLASADLRSQALVRLDRRAEAAAIQEGVFRRTRTAAHWRAWVDLLDDDRRPAAEDVAREVAAAHPDPAAAAELLMTIGDVPAAETVLVAGALGIDRSTWWPLVPLARAMRKAGRPRGETAVLRALLEGILDRAEFRAYHHAAGHWHRLREIAATDVDLRPLVPHTVYEARIAHEHRRKPAFWAHVRGERNRG